MFIPQVSPQAPQASALPSPSLISSLIEKISRFVQTIFEFLTSLFHSLFSSGEQPVAALAERQVAAPPLLNFYRGESPNAAGATLEEILSWNDERLERQHDYIQWLFPTQRPSQYNPHAPLLTPDVQRVFAIDPILINNFDRAFKRILSFYGFERSEDGLSIHAAHNFEERQRNWISPGNHNYLRITRILTSLNLMGRRQDAIEFYHALLNSIDWEKKFDQIGVETFNAWGEASH